MFYPDQAGLSDLYTDDGTKGWITKLDSAEPVTEWLASFDAKGPARPSPTIKPWTSTVAGYSARAIVYQDETGWNSEVLVNFGKDLGNDTYPMYAAYLYFTGPTYLSVWSEDVQAIVNSLTLPPVKGERRNLMLRKPLLLCLLTLLCLGEPDRLRKAPASAEETITQTEPSQTQRPNPHNPRRRPPPSRSCGRTCRPGTISAASPSWAPSPRGDPAEAPAAAPGKGYAEAYPFLADLPQAQL